MGFQIGLVVRNICFGLFPRGWEFHLCYLNLLVCVICLINFINYLVKKIDSCCDSPSEHL